MEIYVLIHNIRSVYNVGSVFRTSDGAGVDKIFISGYTACPPRDDLHKTALGAEESVKWEYTQDPISLIKELKKERFTVVSLEDTESSIDLFEYNFKDKRILLILGNEVDGVEEQFLQISDVITHLPMLGVKESLNVASAFAIAIYNIKFKK